MSTRATISDLLTRAIAEARSRRPDRPPLIGVAGAQGSGKSFQCRAYSAAHAPGIAHFSLDDVYLTHAERENLARELHPLFITRGPPGTHDLALAEDVIDALQRGDPVDLPRFDKARDDRTPTPAWPHFSGPAEAVLFDGWCVGALAPDDANPNLVAPLNALEAEEDADGRWRAKTSDLLSRSYQGFFDWFDAFIYLRAPSFQIVRQWRGAQERETLGRTLTADEERGLDRFIAHYERITRAMLDGRHRARWIVHLDEGRRVTDIEQRAD